MRRIGGEDGRADERSRDEEKDRTEVLAYFRTAPCTPSPLPFSSRWLSSSSPAGWWAGGEKNRPAAGGRGNDRRGATGAFAVRLALARRRRQAVSAGDPRILYVGAQLGVGLYMFLVGVEFQTDLFRSRVRSAACVSIAGMAVPFLLGGLLAPWLVTVPGLFSAKART